MSVLSDDTDSFQINVKECQVSTEDHLKSRLSKPHCNCILTLSVTHTEWKSLRGPGLGLRGQLFSNLWVTEEVRRWQGQANSWRDCLQKAAQSQAQSQAGPARSLHPAPSAAGLGLPAQRAARLQQLTASAPSPSVSLLSRMPSSLWQGKALGLFSPIEKTVWN